MYGEGDKYMRLGLLEESRVEGGVEAQEDIFIFFPAWRPFFASRLFVSICSSKRGKARC